MIGWILLSVAIAAFLLNVVAPWLLSRLAIDYFEADAVLRPLQAKPDPDATLAECKTPDGLRLSLAVWHRDAEGSITVFCPEAGGTKWSTREYANAVVTAQQTVVAFDFRNHGDSDSLPGYKPSHWLSGHEVTDLETVVAWVREQPEFAGREVRLFGVSRGACAAVYVAGRDRLIRSLVADGVYPTRALMLRYLQKWGTLKVPQWVVDYVPQWHLQLTMDFARMASGRRRGCRYVDVGNAAKRLVRHDLLLIAGKRDSYVPTAVTEAFAAAAKVPESRLWIVPGARHNEARQTDPATYDKRVMTVLRSGPPAPEPSAREVSTPPA